MEHFALLPVIIALPLIGAAAVFCVRGDDRVVATNSANVALWVSGGTLALTLFAVARFFAAGGVGVHFLSDGTDTASLPFVWVFGADGLSLMFLVLNALFVLCAVFIGRRRAASTRSSMTLLLLIESFASGALCSRNLFQFFLFYEGVFVPLFLLTALWGALRDEKTFFKQYFYFFLSSVLFFFGLLFLYRRTGTLNFTVLAARQYTLDEQKVLLSLFLPAFMINLPLFPFHVWFKKSQIDAPLLLMPVLSGVMSKLALYGTVAVILPLAGDAVALFRGALVAWAVFSAVYASIAVFSDPNMKQKVVYVHMVQAGIVCAGVFLPSSAAVSASLLFVVMQSIVFVAFLVVLAFLFDRIQTNETARLSGLMTEIPLFGTAFFWALCCYAVLPATPSFLPAFVILNGIFDLSATAGTIATAALILIFIAMISVFSQIMLGERQQTVFPYADLQIKERVLFCVLGGVLMFLTVSPSFFKPYVDDAASVVVTGATFLEKKG